MEGEQERLERLYRELGDEHLLDLADDSDQLTPEAEGVLRRELERRGLAAPQSEPDPIAATQEPERESGFGAGIPGVFPASASMMEQALEPRRTRKGMGSLISFYDGIELSNACELLEDAGMEPSIEAVGGDALTGVPPRFEIWLDAGGIEAAKSLLREKMGLFPLAEVDGEGAGDYEPQGVVGVFGTEAEAAEVKEVLAEQGMVARVEYSADNENYQVRVQPEEQEQAVAIVVSELGLG